MGRKTRKACRAAWKDILAAWGDAEQECWVFRNTFAKKIGERNEGRAEIRAWELCEAGVPYEAGQRGVPLVHAASAWTCVIEIMLFRIK